MTRNTNSNARSTADLDGTWQFRLDPADIGSDEAWYSPDAIWNDADELAVPSCWQEHEEYRDYTGTAWYRTTVEYDGSSERVFLRFGAVDYEATVFVDGEKIGTNREGYLPFEMEVTDAVRPGENVVVVRVSDPENLDEIPHGKQGDPWYTRSSGIWQSVTLESRPSTFVSGVRATPDLDDDTVTVVVEADESGTAAEAATVTVQKDGRDIVTGDCSLSDGSGEVTLSIPGADYWTPETPDLYDLSVELRADGEIIDSYADYFGMRSFERDADRFYLNGAPYYIRGALDQAYYPDTLYRPFDDELFEREIRTAKELGFNMLRKHIKPAHPDFVEAADRLGILVWEEPANPTVYTDRSKQAVRDQLEGMIERDYNSPSVVVWSLYNEEWGIGLDQRDYSDHSDRLWNDEEKQAYLAELFHETKELDPTRLICDNSGWAHVATDINDYHEYFVSPDRTQAWGEALTDIVEHPEQNYATENTSADQSPIVVSEFGTWGFPDLAKLRDHYDGDPPWFSHDFLETPLKRPEGVDERFEETDLPAVFDGFDDLAETWQRREAASLQDIIEQMRVRDGVAGYCVTEFSDIEWEFNGILDYSRDEKPALADEFATVNDDVLLAIDPSRHVLAPSEAITVDVHVVNDTDEPLDGTLRWSALDREWTRTVSVDAFGTTTVADGITVEAATEAGTGHHVITATLDTDDRVVERDEPLAVVAPEGTGDATVYAESPLASALASTGVTVTDTLDVADIAVVHAVDDAVSSFVDAGNAAVVLPGEDGRMVDDDGYRNLPAAESWNLVASLLYQDSDLVGDFCSDARIGWAFEDLFPYDLVDDPDPADEIHVGSVEGWLANWGSPLLVSDHGDGRICRCTFRLTCAYGDHPTATALLNRLLRTL